MVRKGFTEEFVEEEHGVVEGGWDPQPGQVSISNNMAACWSIEKI